MYVYTYMYMYHASGGADQARIRNDTEVFDARFVAGVVTRPEYAVTRKCPMLDFKRAGCITMRT